MSNKFGPLINKHKSTKDNNTDQEEEGGEVFNWNT